MKISFCSDYLEGCHPSILQRLAETNLEQTPGYGLDSYCMEAASHIRRIFACPDADVHFLLGGTQTNTTVISSMLKPYEGVLCADSGHINVHETGAIEAHGHKVIGLPSTEGKISAAQVLAAVDLQGNDEHVVKPGMVYISQSTEIGTIYTHKELLELYTACKQCKLPLYIDGARLGYGLAAGKGDLKPEDLPNCCDVFTVGGTKQGALFGEAVVICNPALMRDFRYMIKQGGGMLAKGRLLGIQFTELLKDGLYFTLAEEAVEKAMRIREVLLKKQLPLAMDSPSNQLFVIFTQAQLQKLQQDFEFSPWQKLEDGSMAVRICTSWCTPAASVDALIAALEAL